MIQKEKMRRKGRMSHKHGRKARVATKKGLVKRGSVPETALPKKERVKLRIRRKKV